MKEFIVKSDGKQFKVKATDYESAIAAVRAVSAKDKSWLDLERGDIIMSDRLDKTAKYKVTNVVTNKEGRPEFATVERLESATLKRKDDPYAFKPVRIRVDNGVRIVDSVRTKDEATQLDIIQALVTDEQAAIAAYTNAIANLDGKVDPQYVEVLRNILKEENKHVENLQAIITGNVTEKNVEDSVKDAMSADELERYLRQKLNNNNIELVVEAYTAANKPVAAYGDGSKTTAASIEHFAKSVGYANVKQERVDGTWVCWVGVTE